MLDWNGGKSIAKWSENHLEGWNKHAGSYQSGPCARARQISVKKNFHDIFRYQNDHVNGVQCGELGHMARSAENKNLQHNVEKSNGRIIYR